MFVKEMKSGFIKNSRGERTIYIKLYTYNGTFLASAPSGKSTGKHEVSAYNENGKDRSLVLLRHICRLLKDKNIFMNDLNDLKKIWTLIDRFEKSFGGLGGNVTYVLESVFLKAAANEAKKELWEFVRGNANDVRMPMPVGNCIGGGLHSMCAGHKVPDFQEFLLIPHEKSFRRAITKNIRAYHFANILLNGRLSRKPKTNDESALITDKTNEEVLTILRKVADKYGLKIGLDVAASSFLDKNYYEYVNKRLTRDRLDQIDYMERLVKKFKIFYLEDPMDEEDFSGFKQILSMTKEYKFKSLIVGDDLTTTNPERLARAIRSKAINAIIIKPNQIGSLLKVEKVVKLAKKNNIKIIFSHRSGETMDTALADYAVAFGADFVKMGIMGKERLVKHKRLLDIEKSLN
jgi:enolase